VPAPAGVVRFTIPPPEGGVFTAYRGASSNLAVSPDGRYVAFVADEPRRDRTIWVRALDSLVAQRLDRTEGATYPFWSPDSQHIAYFAGGKLMRVSMAGGAPLAIADAVDGEGGTWFQAAGQEGVIVFAAGQTGPLQRVLAQGGVPTPVTTLGAGETGHAFPQFLPDGQRFLYLARGEKPAIYVQAIGSDSRTFVVESVGRASFSPPGLLLYMRATTLLAHRWNIESLRLEGEPVAIADDVRNGGVNGRNAFAVSTNGVLAYRFGGAGTEGQIRWYARDGKPGDIVLEAGDYGMIALSPDDRYMAVVRGLQDGRDLWLKDLTSGAFSRLTSALGAETDPVWSPDSRRVAYVGEIESQRRLYETVIGSGKHSPILAGVQSFLEDWTNDGRAIVLRGPTGRSVTQFPAPVENQASPAEGTPQTMLEEVAYAVDTFQVSPDGKWVAYVSAESGQPEIMVASFPAFTNRRQISTDSAGAVQPLWRTDGKELFFVSRRESVVTAVDVNAGATLETGPPRVLFKTLLNTNGQIHFYAVTRDGQRFLVREPVGTNMGTEQLRIVTNWAALVR
jgi:Tol biopolymer transport system component